MDRRGQLSLLQSAAISFLIVGIVAGISVTIQAKFMEQTTDPIADDSINNSIVATKDLTSFNSILALVVVGVVVLGLIFLFTRRQG